MVEVAILSGSASDAAIVEKAAAVLEEHGISYEVRVISAHRDPDVLDEYVKKSDCRVFIAIAGLSAALPGVVSSKTERPVIGVPVSGK
ncbi:MAG TPA: 5-(carboxyamino)imidazole ribonucleotide mutase, partial [Methanoregulaceae archaeon]|nr:5-(carboxyamino)imidazole ribonucleotide mutase [Methanoregulaceae archaeon]